MFFLIPIVVLTSAGGYLYYQNPQIFDKLLSSIPFLKIQDNLRADAISLDEISKTNVSKQIPRAEAKKKPVPAKQFVKQTSKTKSATQNPILKSKPSEKLKFSRKPSKSASPQIAKKPFHSTRPSQKNDIEQRTIIKPGFSMPSAAKTNSTLSLQAIAWSHNPKDRIAVINGHILREGESLEGITINVIEKDAVIVTEGLNTITLEFRIK
jgi:hypothetical protein